VTHSKPRLITFGMSHFCEKARWALDWHAIDYEEISWPPGLHRILAKRCGAKGTTVPILLDGDTVIQSSGAIIDWADEKSRDSNRRLTHPDALEVEQRADEVIGCHVRRLAYAEMLPQFPQFAKTALFHNASKAHRLIGDMMWPVTRQIMMRMYNITPEASSESRRKLEVELDWLDDKLSDGRPYLAGDKFSRADVTVASLLAACARPDQMPIYHDMSIPDALASAYERWRNRPVIRWVVTQYQRHRASISESHTPTVA
jgi:glutathione S-transferase